jgi:histidinol-phosphate aminotransferase
MSDQIKPQPGILDIALYEGGKAHVAGVANVVKLSSNENPFGPSSRAKEAFGRTVHSLHRYPVTDHAALRAAIAEVHGLDASRIICGAGSDEIITFLCQAYAGPKDEVVFTEHGFLMYRISSMAVGATPVEVPERERTADVDAILAACNRRTKLVFIANPNNPTGSFLTAKQISAFLDRVPADVVVVLDEAYNEYLAPELRFDSTHWVRRRANLIVSRTFSKAYGLAGLRVGYAIAQPALTDLLNRVRQPFNCNSVAQAAALAALADDEFLARSYQLNRDGLAQLAAGFDRLGLRHLSSHGNFVLVRVGAADRIYLALLRQGVIVRPVASYGLPEWLRVSVGLPSENESFLAALGKALAGAVS